MGALDTSLLACVRAAGLDSNTVNRNRPYFVGAQTASATLKPSDCYGGIVTNLAAAGTVVLTLPPAKAGMQISGVVEATQALSFTAGTGDTIAVNGAVGAAAGTITADAISEFAQLYCGVNGAWQVIAQVGTWTAT